MAVDLNSYDGVKERETLLKKRGVLKANRDIWNARAKSCATRDEKIKRLAAVSRFTAAQGRIEALEYDLPRLEVELALARLKGSKGLVEVNERLVKQTADNLKLAMAEAAEAYVDLKATLGAIE